MYLKVIKLLGVKEDTFEINCSTFVIDICADIHMHSNSFIRLGQVSALKEYFLTTWHKAELLGRWDRQDNLQISILPSVSKTV